MMLDDNKNHFGGRMTKKEPVTKQELSWTWKTGIGSFRHFFKVKLTLIFFVGIFDFVSV